MNETEKLIEEQLKKLPPSLQRAIHTVPWKASVQEIGKANALDAEQIVSLEQETMFIIYAFEPPTDYIANIVREMGISEDIASKIAESVADKIFDPILQKNDELEKTIKTESVAPVSVPEIPPIILPMPPARQDLASSGQGVKAEIPTPTPKVSLPDYRYPDGKDPYREPLV
ncbi:MAG: hypothetical protein AAB586_00020 [Patescibacteria group bacterium]